ncbi:universal stress protein [Longimicrobium sp.]|uniref:universal stress protein n=1 Tax=Longimicrobium sp. TaxID=2029185 RepID=UPI002E36934B|nr:universal stress protein [Longimicrobium sp.]HEX6036893.1 universal stress protein [Longimicrobium sp.]
MRPILVVSDLTHASDEAVRAAGRLAAASGAALHVTHCAGLMGLPLREALPLLEAGPAARLADGLAAQVRRAVPADVEAAAHVEYRGVREGTLHAADALDAALVVVGTDACGGAALPALAAAAAMPVLVVRDAAPPPFRRVLVPLDAPDVGLGTLRLACEWLRPFERGGACVLPEMHVLHVSRRLADWRGIGGAFEAEVRAVEEDVRRMGGVFHRHVRWAGAAWPAISAAARELDADLVVLRPRRGLPAHGRTWNAVVEHARTNVLLLPGIPAPLRGTGPVEPANAVDAVDSADAAGSAHPADSVDAARSGRQGAGRDAVGAPMGTEVELEPVPA